MSKNLPKMTDFGHFFLTGRQWGGRASDWGKMPRAPPMSPLNPSRGKQKLIGLLMLLTIVVMTFQTEYELWDKMITEPMVMIISKRGAATSKTEDNYDGNDFQNGHVTNKGRHIIIANDWWWWRSCKVRRWRWLSYVFLNRSCATLVWLELEDKISIDEQS